MLFRLRRFRPSLLERAAPRLPAHATRVVRCYRCARSFEASAFAESTVCPGCGGAVRLSDMVLDKGHWGGSVQTAGTVLVPEGATVRSSLIVASGDIAIDGNVHAMLLSGGTIRVGAKAELRGGARCRVLIIEPGAVVRGGPFEAPSDALGTVDIDAAARAIPGKGPAAWVEALEEPAPEPLVITRPVKPPLRVVGGRGIGNGN